VHISVIRIRFFGLSSSRFVNTENNLPKNQPIAQNPLSVEKPVNPLNPGIVYYCAAEIGITRPAQIAPLTLF
jgi:hypothetical protein